MKPIRLTMEAFGSYGEKTVIDFTALNQNLFLISGETGSGKSTIFDAISFALYGSASSTTNIRDGKELQSDYVSRDVTPYVELVFSEGSGAAAELYTVRREPLHVRNISRKTRTGNTTRMISEAVHLTMPDGTEYPQKEADQKLIEIIGLTKDQFAQIVMIAQGEFMELLRADSKKKKEIFRKLFGTEIYENIIRELDQRCKEAMAGLAQIKTVFVTQIAGAVIPADILTGCGQCEELTALKERILKTDRPNIAELEKFIALFGALCGELEIKKQEALTLRGQAGAVREKANNAYQTAKTLTTAFEQLKKAQDELKTYEEMRAETEAMSRLSREIGDAYEIQSVHFRYEEALGREKHTQEELSGLKASLPALEEKQREAAQAEEKADSALKEAQAAYTQTEERVKNARVLFAKIVEAKEMLETATACEQKLTRAAQAAKEAQEAYAKQVQQWRQREEELRGADLRLQEWMNTSRKAEEIGTAIADAETERDEITAQEKICAEAGRAFAAAHALFLEKNAEYEEKYDWFIREQAGILAQHLTEGQPCPVCGSTVHPKPCELSEAHKELTREALDKLAKKVEKLRADMEEKSKASGSAEELLKEKRLHFAQTLERLRRKIVDCMGDVLPGQPFTGQEPLPAEQSQVLVDTKRIFTSWHMALNAQKQSLGTAVAELKSVRLSLANVDGKTVELKQAADEADALAVSAREDLAAARSAYQNLVASQTVFRSEKEAEQALKAAEAHKTAAQKVHTAAKEALNNAKEKVQKSQTLIEQDEKLLPDLRAACDERRAEYETILEQKSMSASTWQNITQQHKKEEAAALADTVNDREKKRIAAQAQLKTAQAAIGEQKEPDMAALEAAKSAAETAWAKADAAWMEVSQIYKTDIDIYESLKDNQAKRADAMQRYERLQSLYERLNGKRTGARMDIETYVQRYHLSRILDAANRRFRDMTEGQFELRMMPEDQAGQGKNRGLDLMVYSYATGLEREINTLSGGESFMAALALSLGIADQVQTGSAVSLDMMFIDEGFGSLSANARTQAVQVLQNMSAGSKMIGIISHVTELQQMIEDQLVVTKDEKGSHIRWEIS